MADTNRSREPLWLLLCLLLAASCAEQRASTSAEWHLPRTAAPPTGDVQVDLVARLPFADQWGETTSLEAARIANRDHLTAGWSSPDHSSDEDAEEIFPVWTDSDHVELTFVIAERAPRRVRVEVLPFLAVRERGSMAMRCSLNGVELETVTVEPGGARLDLALPADEQRVGPNVLAFDTQDSCWRVSEHVEGSGDVRTVGWRANEFSFEIQDEGVLRRHLAGIDLFPAGVEARREEGEAPGVLQLSGHVLRYAMRVPGAKDAVLDLGLAAVARASKVPAGARMRVLLTPARGEEHVLLDEEVTFGEAIRWARAPLQAWGGQIVQLELDVRAADGSGEPVVGLWSRPVLSASPTASPAPPDGLAQARAELAGAPVVCLLLDACNPTFLSPYGGREGLNPTLERLAAEGTVFEHAYTQATYTIASVPSMLTSTFTWEHGAWHETTRLSDAIATWPEAFRDAGYHTAGLTCTPNGSSIFGVDRGFEEFHDLFKLVPDGRETVPAEQILDPCRKAIAAAGDQPLFLWLHIVEPHEPYIPPAPWHGRFSKDLPGTLDGDSDTLWAIREWRLDPGPEDLARIKAQYEENIGYVDEVLGHLLERLDTAGILDEAIVVVFSDHGEGFLDHSGKNLRGMGHGTTAYDDQARIPLIVRLPRGVAPAGQRVESLASSMDILPTVADLVGVPAPATAAHGRSLAAELFDPDFAARQVAVSHFHNLMSKERFLPGLGIRSGPWKYIHGSGHRAELYDLDADPGETENLAERRPIVAAYLRQLLRRRTRLDIDRGGLLLDSPETELDEDTIARMHALGYR